MAIFRVEAAICQLSRDHLTAKGFVEVVGCCLREERGKGYCITGMREMGGGGGFYYCK